MPPPPSPLIPVRVLQAILVLGGLWFLLPIVLPCLLPFLLALLCAALLEGPVAFLTRRGRLPRFLAAALCTLVFFLLLAGGLGLLVWRLGTECAVLLQKTPQLLSAFTGWLGGVRRWAERFLIAAPIPLQETLRGGMEALEDQGMRLLGDTSGLLGTWLAYGASALPQWGLFLFTTALATCLISADRSRLHAFFWRQVPARFRTRLRHMVGAVRDAMTGWLRAQGCLMLVTLCLLTVGFLLLGVDLAILAAGFTALLDACCPGRCSPCCGGRPPWRWDCSSSTACSFSPAASWSPSWWERARVSPLWPRCSPCIPALSCGGRRA